LAADLVQQQGEDDRHREAEDQAVEAQEESISNEPQDIWVLEEWGEVLKADPFTPNDAPSDSVILESDYHPVHGDEMKYDIVEDTG